MNGDLSLAATVAYSRHVTMRGLKSPHSLLAKVPFNLSAWPLDLLVEAKHTFKSVTSIHIISFVEERLKCSLKWLFRQDA